MLPQEDKTIRTFFDYYKHGVIKKKEELHYDVFGNLKKKIEIKYHSNGDVKKKTEVDYPDSFMLGTYINQVCINPNTNTLYISTPDSIIFAVDGNTFKTLDTIQIKNPSRMVVNPKTNKLYVFSRLDKKSHAVAVVDLNSNRIDAIIFGDFKHPNHMAINSSTNMLYVTDWYGSDAVFAIKCDANFIIDKIKIGRGEHAIAIDENRNLIYVTNNADDNVSIINGSTNKVIGEIRIKKPADVFFNPDANILYVKSEKFWGGEGASGVDTYLQLFNSKTQNLLDVKNLGGISPVCVTISSNLVHLISDYVYQKLDAMANEISSIKYGTVFGNQIVVNPITNVGYTTSWDSKKIYILN